MDNFNFFQIDLNVTSQKTQPFVCGKVSNNHEKEWQEQE